MDRNKWLWVFVVFSILNLIFFAITLYDFLERLLFLLDTEGFLLHSIDEIKIEKTKKGYKLEADANGDLADHSYETKGNIKSATYSDMGIKQEDNYCEVIFVLDI